MPGAFFELWFTVRYLHVASIALLAGGATLTATICAAAIDGDLAAGLIAALAYEWIFWSVAALTALTGVSNLGLKGDGLLDASTRWGTALTTKLVVVLTLLALSLVRTQLALDLRAAAEPAPRRTAVALALLYGGSAVAMLLVAWVGLGLAHGRY